MWSICYMGLVGSMCVIYAGRVLELYETGISNAGLILTGELAYTLAPPHRQGNKSWYSTLFTSFEAIKYTKQQCKQVTVT